MFVLQHVMHKQLVEYFDEVECTKLSIINVIIAVLFYNYV